MNFKPSSLINITDLSVIREYALEAEKLGTLHPLQMEIIHKNGWLNGFVPKEFGGLGLTLPEIVELEESISWADGSVGWVVTLCSGAAWFIGFLDPELRHEIQKKDMCFAGSGAAGGTAELKKNSYEISGQWKYASGSLHATVFTANCTIVKNGETVYNNDGSPLIQSFFFKKEEVLINSTWKSVGMIATGSHSFEATNLIIPTNRSFKIHPDFTTLKDPIYKYPFLQLAEVTLAANYSGMALRFFELAMAMIANPKYKMDKVVSKQNEIKAEFDICRNVFYYALNTSWNWCEKKGEIHIDILNQVSESSYGLYKKSLFLVNELYPHCGLVAANPLNEINRVWRNIHTASQHALFARRN